MELDGTELHLAGIQNIFLSTNERPFLISIYLDFVPIKPKQPRHMTLREPAIFVFPASDLPRRPRPTAEAILPSIFP